MATKIKLKVQLSNLIERTFPGLEKILKGHYFGLLLDVYEVYPCASLVREMSEKKFSTKLIKLATKKGHHKGAQLAQKVYQLAHECVTFEPSPEIAKGGNKTCVVPISEIGDVRRFKDSKSLIAYAGIDASPYQSGQFEGTKRHISKRGPEV